MSFKNIDELLNELNDIQTKNQDLFTNQSEELWNNLSKEDQLKLFCAVIKRLTEAELLEKKSYRGVLYDKFEFNLDSYGSALNSGFLKLHNSIYTKDEIKELFKKFFNKNNIEIEDTNIEKFLFDN